PPKVLVAPKPTSSVKINRMLGAPFGASTPFGKSGVESFTVRSILPSNCGSGRGNTSCASAGDKPSNSRPSDINVGVFDIRVSSASELTGRNTARNGDGDRHLR